MNCVAGGRGGPGGGCASMTGSGGAGGPYSGANGGGGCTGGGGGGGPTILCQDFKVSTPSPSCRSPFLFFTGEGSSKSPLG